MNQGAKLWFSVLIVAGVVCPGMTSWAGQVVVKPAKFNNFNSYRLPQDSVKDEELSTKELAEALSIVSLNEDGKEETTDVSEDDVKKLTAGETGSSQGAVGTAPKETGLDSFLDKVIGEDEREEVKNTTDSPYRYFGRLAIGCTGTLVGPRHVLTAGHCVYDTFSDSWYKNNDFTAAQSVDKKPYGTVKYKKIYITKGWSKRANTDFDYALMILQEDVGTKAGWMGFGFNTNLAKLDINIVGYPGDKTKGSMWKSSCTMDDVKADQIHYACDTYGGNSGSAVWSLDKDTNVATIRAVHTNGYTTYNRGTRITASVFHHLSNWIAGN